MPSSTSAVSPFARRRRALMRRLDATLRAMLISHVEDVRYLSGFTGEDSWLLVCDGVGVLVTDGRYDEQARRECPDIEVRVRKGPLVKELKEALRAWRLRRVGIQPEDVTLLARDNLARELGDRALVPVAGAVAGLRKTKDDSEIRAIVRAIRVAERAFRELIAGGAKAFVGRTERDLAAELDYLMRCLGAWAPAFETIVAAGAHASLPHYRPGSTRIRADQAVLIDWGARVAGYCSDLTRVVVTGRIPPGFARLHATVRRAQAAGIKAIRPGAMCRTADAAARKVIDRTEYAGKFAHDLGHGLGREVHEGPGVSALSRERLRDGMVVTVEPGVYLPGVGGCRIEDDVLVTSRGGRRLSRLPRDLQAMVLR